MSNISPGHGVMLHACVCTEQPLQAATPLDIKDFEHVLVLVCVPPPHVSVHSDHRL